MSTTGGFPEPAEREGEEGIDSSITRRYEVEPALAAEPAQAAPTEIVEVVVPSGGSRLPVRRPTGVVVRRRKLALMYLVIFALVVVVAAMAYVMVTNKSNQVAAVSSNSSRTASAQDSATSTGTGTDSSPSSSGVAGASNSPGSSASGSASDGSSATSTGGTAATDGGTGFTPPFGTEYLPAPVDGDVYTHQDVHIGNVDYATSSSFYCPTSGLIDWNVAGYKTFTAEFGIPDDAQSATGVSNTVTFTDQNGKTLGQSTTSLGQQVKISLSVSGVDRLIMSCARQGTNNSTNNLVALGNALLATS
jgi:hypothetical protein